MLKRTYSATQGALDIKADATGPMGNLHPHRPAAEWERNHEETKIVPGADIQTVEPGSKCCLLE